MEKITIIGSGLTGPLLSILFAKRGYKVELYEKRLDPRQESISAGRSINLALSHRGIKALKLAKVFKQVELNLIPMKGRMIHHSNGNLDFQPYSINPNEFINSVSRAELNKILMTEAENTNNVNIHFDEALIEINNDILKFCSGKTIPNEGIIFGADGAGSLVRQFIDKSSKPKSKKEPLGHSYKELNISPSNTNDFQLDVNSLHIWPRGEFMLIALPNLDKSFTCTLFMPNNGKISFESLKTENQVTDFFKSYFADALPLLENFPQSFFLNPIGKLATIYTQNWHKDKICIIGDAAHAVVPFFGQGMNASFEDCEILMECLDNQEDWNNIFSTFNQRRKPDADAIAKMAIENYIEMRDSVTKDEFINKKEIANSLFKNFPNRFIPQYNMVSFTSISYKEVYNRAKIQKEIIQILNTENFDLKDAENLIKSKLIPIS